MEEILSNVTDNQPSTVLPWAWNGSNDTLSAFMYHLLRHLSSDGRCVLIHETGAVFNAKSYKTVYMSIEHFHKDQYCKAQGLEFSLKQPFEVPALVFPPAIQPAPPAGPPPDGAAVAPIGNAGGAWAQGPPGGGPPVPPGIPPGFNPNVPANLINAAGAIAAPFPMPYLLPSRQLAPEPLQWPNTPMLSRLHI